jgi:crotonobetainyl-CoA:carnitine CoA-transferase CaiB-like acyl-CoA transferase
MDGAVQIAVGSESLWKRFCAEFDLDPAAEGMATNAERVANREKVIAIVEQAFSTVAAADLLPRLAEAGIPAGKVRTLDEVYEWDQTRSQGLLLDLDHPKLGKIAVPGPPLRFFEVEDGAENETTLSGHRPPPGLDADSDSIRAWLADGEGS